SSPSTPSSPRTTPSWRTCALITRPWIRISSSGCAGRSRDSAAVTIRTLDTGDRVIALTIVALTCAYLAALPRYLGWADESYFLYEAKRIRAGEAMYRDIFKFITPLASYVMALLFWAFGTTLATARIAMSVLHGILCACLYAIARLAGVRRSLAL